jgi:peptidoglycan/LPS O-acetylase OafA/YrhL
MLAGESTFGDEDKRCEAFTMVVDGKPGRASGRVPQLDVLRGVAILLVLGFHPAVKADQAGALAPVVIAWHAIGWTGVDLFFVLSGYLIGGLLLAEHAASGRIDLWRFWFRRAMKIWPPYAAYLAVFALLLWSAGKPLTLIGPNLLHVQNYVPTPAGHTWSLAVEEHFYLALPLVLIPLLAIRGERYLLPGFAVIALACGIGRYFQCPGTARDFRTHLRFDSLAFGVTLAWMTLSGNPAIRFIAERPRRTVLFCLGLAGLAVVIRPGSPIFSAVVPAIIYLGYGGILVATVSAPMPKSRILEWLAMIGVYSYAIYLWHVETAYSIALRLAASFPSGPLTWLLLTAVYLSLAIAVGVLMTRCIERPALAMRDRLMPWVRTAGLSDPAPMARDRKARRSRTKSDRR